MKSIWKGHLKFGMLILPVKLYNAINTGEKISFNQLHKKDNSPIGYDKKCKKCGTVCEASEIVKGYKYGEDQYAIISDAELNSVKIKSTKVIDLEVFVDPSCVEPVAVEAASYLGPDGAVALEPYGLLRQALIDTNKVGIGKLAIRDKEDLVAVIPHKSGLLMLRLRYPNEIQNIRMLPDLDRVPEPTAEKRMLARSLVESMIGDVSVVDQTDRYTSALRNLIEAKIAGTEPAVVAEAAEEKPAADIMAVLKASLEAAKTKKTPKAKETKAVAKKK